MYNGIFDVKVRRFNRTEWENQLCGLCIAERPSEFARRSPSLACLPPPQFALLGGKSLDLKVGECDGFRGPPQHIRLQYIHEMHAQGSLSINECARTSGRPTQSKACPHSRPPAPRRVIQLDANSRGPAPSVAYGSDAARPSHVP